MSQLLSAFEIGIGHRVRPAGHNVFEINTPMHLEHGSFSGLCVDALVVACSRTWGFSKYGHECSSNGTLSNMNLTIVWAWMLWYSNMNAVLLH